MKKHPFHEVVKSAEEAAKMGGRVHQRFECEACGNDTLGIEEPYTFYEKGECDRCGHVTDLVKTGCNFCVLFKL